MFLCAPFHFPPTFYKSINFQEHPFLFKTNGKFFHHLYELFFSWQGLSLGPFYILREDFLGTVLQQRADAARQPRPATVPTWHQP